MTKPMQIPLSSMLSSTAVTPPVFKAAAMAQSQKPAVDWEIVYAGARRVPVMQYKHLEPGKMLASILLELGWMSEEHMSGRIILPPGLREKTGIRLQVDNGTPSARHFFDSFDAKGCMVALNWRRGMIESVYSGQFLHIHSEIASRKKPIVFSVPIDRFAQVAGELKQIVIQRSQ